MREFYLNSSRKQFLKMRRKKALLWGVYRLKAVCVRFKDFGYLLTVRGGSRMAGVWDRLRLKIKKEKMLCITWSQKQKNNARSR